jgi:hypothetical protein
MDGERSFCKVKLNQLRNKLPQRLSTRCEYEYRRGGAGETSQVSRVSRAESTTLDSLE